MAHLSVNLEHIATLRQAGNGRDPDPVQAAVLAELAGAHAIAAPLHIHRRALMDRDVYLLKQTVSTRLNLKVHPTPEMVQLAIDVTPQRVTFIADSRDEQAATPCIPVRGHEHELQKYIEELHEHNIPVCIQTLPDIHDVKAAAKIGAAGIDIHAGLYTLATGRARQEERDKIRDITYGANKFGLPVSVSGGIDFPTTAELADEESISEIEIGHSCIARATLVGMEVAVRDLIGML